MLYKKKDDKKLDLKLFENPTDEYRGAPFWSWNCKVTKELIDHQIDVYKQMGIGGFTIHARTGLETEYMSDEFLNLFHTVMRKQNQWECTAIFMMKTGMHQVRQEEW